MTFETAADSRLSHPERRVASGNPASPGRKPEVAAAKCAVRGRHADGRSAANNHVGYGIGSRTGIRAMFVALDRWQLALIQQPEAVVHPDDGMVRVGSRQGVRHEKST